MNLTIINFNNTPSIQFDQLLERTSESSYIFINNGLDSTETKHLRNIFDNMRSHGTNIRMIEYSQPQKTGGILNEVLTLAINDPTLEFTSFVDTNALGRDLDAQLAILKEYPALVCGTNNPNLKHDLEKEMLDIGINTIPQKEHLGKTIALANHSIKPHIGIDTPFTLNMGVLRYGARNPQTFNVIAQAMQECLPTNKNANFGKFFSYLYVGFLQTTYPVFPIVASL